MSTNNRSSKKNVIRETKSEQMIEETPKKYPKIVMLDHCEIEKGGYSNDFCIKSGKKNIDQYASNIMQLFDAVGYPTHILYSPYIATMETAFLIKDMFQVRSSLPFPEENVMSCPLLSRRYPPNLANRFSEGETLESTVSEETLKRGALMKLESFNQTDDRIHNLFDLIGNDFTGDCIVYMVTHKFIISRAKHVLQFNNPDEKSEISSLGGIAVDYYGKNRFIYFNFEEIKNNYKNYKKKY